MKLIQLHIKNFRSIKDSGDIGEITKIFALIGRNNAGKSCFLKAVEIIFATKEAEDSDFHKNTKDDIEISGVVQTDPADDKSRCDVKIIAKKSGRTQYFINGKEVAKTAYKKSVPPLLSISDIRNPNDSTTGGQKTTMLQKILQLQEISDKEEFAKEFDDLSKKIVDLKNRESKTLSTRLTSKFKEVTGEDFFAINISPEVNVEKGIAYSTAVQNTNIPDSHPVDILSSGTGLQSMYILSLLEVYGELSVKDSDAILIVEEPEVYLHPTYQRRMFAALRRIAESNQVIFTTHSPIMISDIWLTESVRQVVLSKNGETKIENVKVENVIDELGIRYEDVLNPKIILFVEGRGDVRFYKKLGIDQPAIRTIPTDSFRAIHYFAFIRIITSENVSSEFVLLADRDAEEPKKRKEHLIQEITKQFQTPPAHLEKMLQDKIFVLEKYAIESYFLEEETIIKSFPNIEADSIKGMLKEYWAKYAQSEKDMNEGKLKKENFQRFLKPKEVFTTFKNEAAEKAYRDFWKGSATFITVRQLIALECKELGANGIDPFEHILGCADLSKHKELIGVRDSILALAKRED